MSKRKISTDMTAEVAKRASGWEWRVMDGGYCLGSGYTVTRRGAKIQARRTIREIEMNRNPWEAA